TTPARGTVVSNVTTVVDSSTFSNNTSAVVGGLFINVTDPAATTTVKNSTFSGNVAVSGFAGGSGGGDGGYTYGAASIGAVTLQNCTITGNSAGTGGGGFSEVATASAAAPLSIQNCTITGNTANTLGGAYEGGGIWVKNGTGPFTMDSTIVANNTANSA